MADWPVDTALANAPGYTAEQIAMMFEGLSADDARWVIDFDKQAQERTERSHTA